MSPDESTSLWTAEDWSQAEQAWLDWREAFTRRFEAPFKLTLEQAWAAGLLDSEVSIQSASAGNDVNKPAATLSIRQAGGAQGHINLLRFHQAVDNAGTITGPHQDGDQTYHVWQTTSDDDLEKVWFAIGPFLGPVKFSMFRHALVTPALRALPEAKPHRARRRKRDRDWDRRAGPDGMENEARAARPAVPGSKT